MSAASRRRKKIKQERKKMAQKVVFKKVEEPLPIEQEDFYEDYTEGDNDANPYTIIKQLSERENDNTPDWRDRKIEDWIPIFVYGTLKAGGCLHSVLKDAFWLGDGVTAGRGWKMYDTGGFPVVRPISDTDPTAGKITGELYMVDPLTLLELDRIEGNGCMYQREKVWLWAQDQSVERVNPETGELTKGKPGIQAWMYVGMNDFWKGRNLAQVFPKRSNNTLFYDYLN